MIKLSKLDLIEHIIGRLEDDEYVLINKQDEEEMAAIQELLDAGLVVERPSHLDSDGYMDYVLKNDG